MAELTHNKALSLIAGAVASTAIAEAITSESISWEDFPEIGENDWSLIVSSVMLFAAGINPAPDDFTEAVALLESLAKESVNED